MYSTLSLLTFMAALAAHGASAEDRPNEHIVLANCNPNPSDEVRAYQILYYPDLPYDGDNNPIPPEMNIEIPGWNGWNSEPGASGYFDNGDEVTVKINSNVPEFWWSQSDAGTVRHTYGIPDFSCYPDHDRSRIVFTMEDGTDCYHAYLCYHWQTGRLPLVNPGPAGSSTQLGSGSGSSNTTAAPAPTSTCLQERRKEVRFMA